MIIRCISLPPSFSPSFQREKTCDLLFASLGEKGDFL